MCTALPSKGIAGLLTNPVATIAGKDSGLAQINKAAVDPGGAFLKGPSVVDGIVPVEIRDPYMIGDQKREMESRQKSMLASYSQRSQTKQRSTVLGR